MVFNNENVSLWERASLETLTGLLFVFMLLMARAEYRSDRRLPL